MAQATTEQLKKLEESLREALQATRDEVFAAHAQSGTALTERFAGCEKALCGRLESALNGYEKTLDLVEELFAKLSERVTALELAQPAAAMKQGVSGAPLNVVGGGAGAPPALNVLQ